MSNTLKFALLILGAAVLALMARVLFASMMGNAAPADPQVQIRVAAGDLPAGLLLRNEDIAWQAVPKSRLPQGALVQGTPAADDMGGVLVRHDMKTGARLLAQDVIRPDAAGFLAAVLKPGMRAVSVPIDIVSGNAGLIQPGDYVDMILTQTTRAKDNANVNESRARSVVSETVIENVRVIAVGSVFQLSKSEAVEVNRNKTPARTVTIEVAPRAAEAVTVASRLGTLSMALRSFAVADRNASSDAQAGSIVAWGESAEQASPVWAGDVSRAIGGEDPAPAAVDTEAKVQPEPVASGPREITVMRGSKREQQKLGVQ
ncbi:Flp pilus assembly protein CpaB [Pusillimonas sp. TS35]|uniref:Flp pilus assembly protein CpaB n=1 Tax=Paracandidimonas lactea TaxID=2895524 RepID=UPI0013694D60|nr:Flp pilus assembly protein CpaB [Paracandidimonas lactea]MYN13501.1 Flp pilus assembly protein CpaB [Pusillimonas sp. TS35]